MMSRLADRARTQDVPGESRGRGPKWPDDVAGNWPLAGRVDELRHIAALRNAHARGVLLVGPPGVGKTRLAAEFAGRAERDGAAVVRITATRPSAAIPFGVFAPLLADVLNREAGGGPGRERLIHLCASAIVEAAGGRPLVLMVDNAHLLDEGSASLVHQMVAADAAFIVGTVLGGVPVPDPVLALWKDDAVERLEVGGLGRTEVEQVLAEVLGGPVDPAMCSRLLARSEGNVLYLRELVLGAIADRTLIRDMGIWRLCGPTEVSGRLTELVESRLAGLRPEERDLLELVSFGEPLEPAEIAALADPELADLLERRDLLGSSVVGSRTQIRLGHPLFAEVLRARTPAMRRRRIAELLARALESAGACGEDDVLRIGAWHLESGGGDPDLLLAAASVARWRYDFPLAERLAQAALKAGAGFDAAVLAAQLMFLLGRSTEAEAALSDLMMRAQDDRQRHIVAMTSLDHRSFMGGRIDTGLQLAKEIEPTIEDPEFRDEVRAKRAALTAGFDGPRSGAVLAEPILERSSGRACVWSAIAVGYALSRVGRLHAAMAAADKGYAEHLRLVEPLEWYPWVHQFVRGEALAHSGQLGEAYALATRQYEQGIADRSPEAQAWFSWQLCKLVSERGFPRAAAVHGRTAVALFRELAQPQFQHFALGHLSMALALSGDTDEAKRALAAMDDLDLGRSMYWACDVLQARAWVAAVDGDLARANAVLAEARGMAAGTGDRVGECSTLHMMGRLGSPSEVVEPITELASVIDGSLVTLRATHIRALVASDAPALERLSVRFEGIEATLLAAEAAADAATAWRAAGSARRAAIAERRSDFLARRCESPTTPTILTARGRSRLTRAERQVAELAATGISNQQIAQRLCVSRRTVENQLQHTYQKMGLAGRSELRNALAAADGDDSQPREPDGARTTGRVTGPDTARVTGR